MEGFSKPLRGAHRPTPFDLYGLELKLLPPHRVTGCDVVFLALPTEAASERFLADNAKVIDLGAALRLRDRETWEGRL